MAQPSTSPIVGSPSAGRNRELDGLRALAVISVFAFHIVPAAPALYELGWSTEFEVFGATVRPPTQVFDYLFHLNLGVQIFFVLSGFLITSIFVVPWLAERPGPALGPYALRRAARIFPAYWLVLFIAGSAWFGLEEITFPQSFGAWKHATLTYYFFPQTFASSLGGVDYGGLRVSWSLVAEITFYAFVPLWMVAVGRLAKGRATDRARVALGAAAACVPVGVVCVFVFTYRTPWATEVPFGGLLTVFGAGLVSLGSGMVLAVLVARAATTGDDRLVALGRRVGIWWSGAAAAYVVLAWPENGFLGATPGQQTWQRLVQPVVATLIVAPIVFAPGASTRAHRLLRSRVLVWIGTISYGIYLWHTIVIARVLADHPIHQRGVAGASLVIAVVAAITTVIAAASWYLVERPLLVWSRSWRRRRGRTGPSPTLAPS